MLADRFLVLNGDVLCDLDLTALIAQHERTGARATIALYPVDDPTGYGLVHRHEDGEITEFLEKPEPGADRHATRSTPAPICWSARCSS